jgi:hypothetical protein
VPQWPHRQRRLVVVLEQSRSQTRGGG